MSKTPLNCSTSKIPIESKIVGCISYISGVIANFVLKFECFRYHGDEGSYELNFGDNVKLLDLENPLFGARFSDISLIEAEL